MDDRRWADGGCAGSTVASATTTMSTTYEKRKEDLTKGKRPNYK